MPITTGTDGIEEVEGIPRLVMDKGANVAFVGALERPEG